MPTAVRPHADQYVVLHLWPGGANFEERSWPVDRWRAVAEALNARGYDVVLTGGPGDVAPERGAVHRVAGRGHPRHVRRRGDAGGDAGLACASRRVWSA